MLGGTKAKQSGDFKIIFELRKTKNDEFVR
jgi:hypothetical protein